MTPANSWAAADEWGAVSSASNFLSPADLGTKAINFGPATALTSSDVLKGNLASATTVAMVAAGGSFTARAPGGVRFLTATNNVGVQLPAAASAWSSLSDRNAKTAVTPVDHRKTLRKVASLPVTAWQYTHNPGRRHVGPMAQDFHATFGLGFDDKHISTLDTDGVTLSALKGLIAELELRKQRSAAQAKRLQELQAELEKLQKLAANLPPVPGESAGPASRT